MLVILGVHPRVNERLAPKWWALKKLVPDLNMAIFLVSMLNFWGNSEFCLWFCWLSTFVWKETAKQVIVCEIKMAAVYQELTKKNQLWDSRVKSQKLQPRMCLEVSNWLLLNLLPSLKLTGRRFPKRKGSFFPPLIFRDKINSLWSFQGGCPTCT